MLRHVLIGLIKELSGPVARQEEVWLESQTEKTLGRRAESWEWPADTEEADEHAVLRYRPEPVVERR